MDILSDVKVVGNLTASETICGKKLKAFNVELYNLIASNSILTVDAGLVTFANRLMISGSLASFNVESKFNCAVTMCKQLTIQSSLKFDSGAKICGGEFTDKVLMEIPANCSKFQITDCTSSPVSIQAFMMDSDSNWNNVELDFKFEKIEDSKSYKPIATISTAFTESKQMYFILGR